MSSAAPHSRDPWLDNAKMALVTLVVVGHGWALLPQTSAIAGLYDFVYAWHMPAFVFVTGYLSRSFGYDRRRLWQLVRTVAVPYLVFETLLVSFRIHVGGEQLERLYLEPHWPMWFLAALFCWRLLTPVFRDLPGGVAVAVLLSLTAGLWAGDVLDMGRVFGLLPFFVLGLKATPEALEWLRGPMPRTLALVAFGTIAYLAAITDRFASTEWLYYRAMYADMDTPDDRGMLTRLVLLAIGCAGALAFLALLPRRETWFARMGSASLVVYLVHGFVVKAAGYAGFSEWATAHPWPSLAVATVGGVATALLLAWPPVADRLQVVVDPVGSVQRRVRPSAPVVPTHDVDRDGARARPSSLIP